MFEQEEHSDEERGSNEINAEFEENANPPSVEPHPLVVHKPTPTDLLTSKTTPYVIAGLATVGTFIAIPFSPVAAVVLTGVTIMSGLMGYSLLKTKESHRKNQNADQKNQEIAESSDEERIKPPSQDSYVNTLSKLNVASLTLHAAGTAMLAYQTHESEENTDKEEWALYTGIALGAASVVASTACHVYTNAKLRERATQLELEKDELKERRIRKLEENYEDEKAAKRNAIVEKFNTSIESFKTELRLIKYLLNHADLDSNKLKKHVDRLQKTRTNIIAQYEQNRQLIDKQTTDEVNQYREKIFGKYDTLMKEYAEKEAKSHDSSPVSSSPTPMLGNHSGDG